VELQRLVFSFFNAEVASRYWLGHRLRHVGHHAILRSRWWRPASLPGLALAMLRSFQVKPASFLIVVFADVFRALPPLS
jgi:hypothetical protein